MTNEEVRHLATLARIALSDEEIEQLGTDMTNILGYVGQVSAVAAQAPVSLVPELGNIFREDVARSDQDPLADKRDALIAAFPTREGDYNSVRKIISKD